MVYSLISPLEELARINTKRPYFLLVHVRESSDVKRVKGILDKLGRQLEIVPLDVFFDDGRSESHLLRAISGTVSQMKNRLA